MSKTAAPQAKTPGVKKAQAGEFAFEMAKVNHLMGGPDYSTANGSAIEGDRMMVALMRMPAGTGAEPHSHPNEQWIYILEGVFEAVVGGKPINAPAGTILYIPSNTRHEGKASKDGDVLFFTVKDTTHGLYGIKAN